MSKSITGYVRSQVSPAGSYRLAAREHHPENIYLNLNESPYPLSPKARQVIREFNAGNRYPDFSQAPLRKQIGEYVGFPAERIALGAGLDDVFSVLATLFIEPGKEVVISNPTFGIYASLFPLHGARIVDVPLSPAPDFTFNPDGVIAAVNENTAFVMICNPNNPTGNLLPMEDIEKVVTSVDCPVAIDEAYAEFAGVDHLELARKYSNVIILRTLSKFAGLAGIRVGYAIFPEDMTDYLPAAVPAFANISALSAEIAIASLNDLDYLAANRDEQVKERERVTAALNKIPNITAYPSTTNFVMFDVPGDDATYALDALKERRIYVRHYPSPDLGLVGHLRVSIGLPEENTAFLSAIEEVITQEVGV